MDIDDEVGEEKNLHLLVSPELETIPDEKHLEDVDAIAHPSGVVGWSKPFCHLYAWALTDEELWLKDILISLLYGFIHYKCALHAMK